MCYRLLQLKNVLGVPSWNGRWSEGSETWDMVPKEMIPKWSFGQYYKNGVFWISLDDFLRYIYYSVQ